MKSVVKLLIFALVLGSQSTYGKFNLPLPFGTHQRILKVKELPDTAAYQLKDGTYYDIGSMYEIKHIFGLSYSSSEPEYIGYINSQDSYVEISQKELNTIILTTGIGIPEKAKHSFFDKFISRPLLLFIFMGIGYSSRKYFVKHHNQRAENNEDDVVSWPPKRVHE